MSGITNKVKDAVGLGSHDSNTQSTGLTAGSTHSTAGHNVAPNDSLRSGSAVQDSLSPNAAQTKPQGRRISDAAQMPPSEFRKLVGEPTIEHDYPHDSSTKRHSVSHQEKEYMR